MDLFDKPDTLQRVWQRLVMGYALDAIVGQNEKARPFTADDAHTVLNQAGDLACEPCPSVGVGEDWRFESNALVGHALVAGDTCVHLSVFPSGDEDQDGASASAIQPPSQRRPRSSGSRGGWLAWLWRSLQGD